VDVDRLDGLVLHLDVPDLEREVVSREDEPSVFGELDVRDGGDDFREERLVGGILLFLELCIDEDDEAKGCLARGSSSSREKV